MLKWRNRLNELIKNKDIHSEELRNFKEITLIGKQNYLKSMRTKISFPISTYERNFINLIITLKVFYYSCIIEYFITE